MDPGLAALIGAIIGGLAGVGGAMLGAYVQSRGETKRWLWAQRAEAEAEVNLQIAEVARQLFAVQHSIEWVAWYARHEPDRITPELGARYEAEIHDTFPSLVGGLAVLAALSPEAYQRLDALARELYDLDTNVSKNMPRAGAPGSGDLQALADLLGAVQEIYNRFPPVIADVRRRAAASR